jgi:hypothetical protein
VTDIHAAALFDTAFGVATGSVADRKWAATRAATIVAAALRERPARNGLAGIQAEVEALLGMRGAAKVLAEARRLVVPTQPGRRATWKLNDHPSVSILTSKASAEVAAALYDRLAAAGADVWFYDKSIKLGRRIRNEDDRALERADYVVLLVSHDALDSNFVGYELDVVHWLEMKERRERLLPIIVDDLPYDDLPPMLGPIRAIALRDSGIDGVVEAIKERMQEDKGRKSRS